MAHDRFPTFRQIVLDTTDTRGLAEFYRQLLGWQYRPGDEPPADGQPGPDGEEWLVIQDAAGLRIALQQVASLPEVTWPEGPIPQQAHLDVTVADRADLDVQHDRAMALGARLIEDRADDPEETLRIYADPAGHPFCLFAPNPGES